MKWRKEGPHLSVSDQGYKVARYKIGDQIIYRASLQGSFICAPMGTAADAAKACVEHQKNGKKA